jgi:hypothetical protein
MAHYRADRAKAKALVDHYSDSLEEHFENLRDKDYRAELASSAISDIVSGIRPMRMVNAMFGQEQGIAGNLIATLLASKAKSFKGKVLAWVAATVGPMVLDRVLHSEWLDQWIRGVKDEDEDEDEDFEEDEVHSNSPSGVPGAV